MSLHMVRNGILTVVQDVLQILSVLGLVTDVVGSSDTLLVCTTRVVVADLAALACLRLGVVRRERTQRARRQRIVIARVGGAGAAGLDWYTMRLNHVLPFEQQKSMLAWGKQTLSACMRSRRDSDMHGFVGVSFVVRKCYSPCFCSEARCGRDGPGAYV